MSRRARAIRPLGDLPPDLHLPVRGWQHAGNGVLPRSTARAGYFSSAQEFITKTDSLQVLPLNVKRVYLLVYNIDATNNLWINLTNLARVNKCIKVPPGGNWEPWNAPINEIHVIGDTVGQSVIIVEGTGL